MIKKVDGCKNNPEKSSTIKVGEHFPCRHSMSAIWTFNGKENNHNVYRGKNCMKNFCESLREHAMKIINFEKKKIIPLTKEQQESYEKTKIC